MIELITSDPAILIFAGTGLVATTVSILRDTRAQRRLAARGNLVSIAERHASAQEPAEAAA